MFEYTEVSKNIQSSRFIFQDLLSKQYFASIDHHKILGTRGNSEMEPSVDQNCMMFLMGSFSLRGPLGENLTPRNQKAMAILALIACSNRGVRSRSWLSDKLWSDRAPEQALGSLRQALSDIRKSLGTYCDKLLTIDNFNVSLNLEAIWVDVFEIRTAQETGAQLTQSRRLINAEFLEGLDIRDQEFENWLTVERSYWEDVRSAISLSADRGHKESNQILGAESQVLSPLCQLVPETLVRPVIGILAPVTDVNVPDAREFALLLTNLFVQSINDFEQVDLADLRGRDTSTLVQRLPREAVRLPQVAVLYFKVRVYRLNGDLTAELSLVESDSAKVAWMTSVTSTANLSQVSTNVDILAKLSFAADSALGYISSLQLAAAQDQKSQASLLTLRAIEKIFDIDGETLKTAEHDLLSALELDQSSQNYAWAAFLQTFTIGQKYDTIEQLELEKVDFLARKSIELDPNNALSLALCAHVFSYVFRNYEFATDLFVKSLKLNPNRALSWDLFSVLHAYIGRPDVGLRCADWARKISTYSPHSFYFDTSCCIAASLSGRHEDAIKFGLKAINRRPNYNPALRFMLSSYGLIGDKRAAENCLEKLLAIEPDFSISSYLEAPYPNVHDDQKKQFLRGLRRAGVPKYAETRL